MIPGIIIHHFNNSIAFLGMILSKEENLTKNLAEEFENQWVYWLIVIAAGLVASVGIWILHEKYFKRKELA